MPKQHVLGQKASAAQRALEARGMSPAKAMRRALSRSAIVLWNLALQSQSVEIDMLDQDECAEALEDSDLLILLDGPDGAIGFAGFDRQIMTGLVEVQTLLQVTSLPVEERTLTATDAALTAPLIDETLMRFEDNLDESPLRERLGGFRFGAMIEDARSAALLLNAAEYRVFRMDIDLGLGKRQGMMQFILPDLDRNQTAAAGAADVAGAPGPFEAQMMCVPARLEAVLCRLKMPLSRARKLTRGDLIPLPADALGVAELCSGGQVIGGGRLGQINGLRAIRLTWPAGSAAVGAAFMTKDEDALSDAEAAPPENRVKAPPASFENEELPELPSLDFPEPDEDLQERAPDASDDDLGDFDFGAAAMGAEVGDDWPTE